MLRECGAICWRVLAWICWRVLACAGVCWRGFAGVCWRVLYGAIVGVNGRLAIVLLRCVGVGLGTRK